MPVPARTPLAELGWVHRSKLAPLARLGIECPGDLLRHFPRRYEDRTRFDRFPDGETERPLCLFGVVETTSYRRFGPRRIFEARVADESGGLLGGSLTCRWFNMPWMRNLLVNGDRVVLFGRPRVRGRSLAMEHPEFEVLEDDAESLVHFDRITPIHPAGNGVSPRIIRSLVHRALAESEPPEFLWKRADVPLDVWRKVHFPENSEELSEARRFLVLEEFFGVQLIVCARRAEMAAVPGVARPGTGAIWSAVERSLPFTLTEGQRSVIDEISTDLAAPRRMNRLLQGDVGSGKTLVALHAMLQTVESGWQAALMAPTQILAEQHYAVFKRLLDPLGILVALRTGSRKTGTLDAGDLPGLSGTPTGAGVVVGTHALLFETESAPRTGLVVIDEQHKFGVVQRARLIARSDAPDVLVMTATPIPRTITQTLYGDLDVSILRDRPAARGQVVTAIRPTSKLPDILSFLRTELAAGRQAYIVYPLVEESDRTAAKAATVELERWRTELAPAAVGLVHGRMPPGEKDAAMEAFRSGRLACLVATTVIEVGVDVPNATVMLIENAERFGLSQLHQLRGRIGRGSQKSYCILLSDETGSEAMEKLRAMERTGDGFEIAETDLQLRGPGDILGTEQTGFPPLRLGDILRDGDLMTLARRQAQDVLTSDPQLSHPEHVALREFVAAARHRLAAPIEG